MNKCAHCSSTKFGLIVHRWWGLKFCKKTCLQTYLAKLAQERERVKQWLNYLRPP